MNSLPLGLLDLTLCRANALRATTIAAGWRRVNARRLHQAVLATPPPPAMEHFDMQTQGIGQGRRTRRLHGALSVRSTMGEKEPKFELEKRVQALEVAALEEETSLTPPSYTETELMFFYEDLLAIPQKPEHQVDLGDLERKQAEQDAITLQEANHRLLQSHPEVQTQDEGQHLAHSELPPYRSVLTRAQAIVAELEVLGGLAMKSSSQPGGDTSPIAVPISVLSIKECEALVRVCTKAEDAFSAISVLEIMKRCGMSIPESAVTDTLDIFATAGDVQAAESLIANFITSPTEQQRHLHVKCHLRATPLDIIPTSALAVLHSYEEKALFAPMKTYTSLIVTLFSRHSSIAHAQAWDLFTHMRYVAHPDPDAFLYTKMIRSCAFPQTSACSEPEKAMDFWTEMTVDRRLEPTVDTYNAIILACARSGTKVYVNEAYRLAKEMLDSHRDAHGVSAFRPNRKTFCALLEGAKRIGDLGRARWILAEMIRADPGDPNAPRDAGVNEEVMMHLFQAYAKYQAPFKREATLVVQEEPSSTLEASPVEPSLSAAGEAPSDLAGPTSIALDSAPSFSHLPPQSSAEVLHEATFLFQRILNDTGIVSAPGHQDDFSQNILNKFSGVNLSSRLVGSYVTVFLRHASLDVARAMFWKLFDRVQVPRNATAYVDAMERCAYSGKGRDREVAVEFMNELWAQWELVEASGLDGNKKLRARLIERAHIARLRLYATTDDISNAMRHLRSFASRYPPASVRQPPVKPALRSTRTSLVGARPLVRMTTTAEVPDDTVPPLLTFRDLEALHHRLVVFGMQEEISYVKWLGKAYEWMLRVRRDEGFRARPVDVDVVV